MQGVKAVKSTFQDALRASYFISKAEMYSLVQSNTVVDPIVKTVLSNMEFIVSITETVAKMMKRAVDVYIRLDV